MKKVSVYQIKPEMIPEMLSDLPMKLLFNSDEITGILYSMYKSERFYDFCYMYNTPVESVGDIIERTFEEGNYDSELSDNLYRSMSSGDIVTIDDEVFIIAPIGFKKIV